MTQRTKRVINVMQKKSSKLRKQLDDYDLEHKRRNDEFKSDTCRRSEDRIDEIKKRAGSSKLLDLKKK
jgi:hypothetical protein